MRVHSSGGKDSKQTHEISAAIRLKQNKEDKKNDH